MVKIFEGSVTGEYFKVTPEGKLFWNEDLTPALRQSGNIFIKIKV
jgi:hypothetical protein